MSKIFIDEIKDLKENIQKEYTEDSKKNTILILDNLIKKELVKKVKENPTITSYDTKIKYDGDTDIKIIKEVVDYSEYKKFVNMPFSLNLLEKLCDENGIQMESITDGLYQTLIFIIKA